jgi:hypothetical protein
MRAPTETEVAIGLVGVVSVGLCLSILSTALGAFSEGEVFGAFVMGAFGILAVGLTASILLAVLRR